MKEANFKIKVTVSGGITGTRTAYLKRKGIEVLFETREEAEDYAGDCRIFSGHLHSNQSPHLDSANSQATFTYEVVDFYDDMTSFKMGPDRLKAWEEHPETELLPKAIDDMKKGKLRR